MYILIQDNKITGYSEYPFEGCTKEVSLSFEEYSKNPEKWMLKDNELILNPNYEAQQEEKEKERIAKLNMTKLDFVKFLNEYRVSYAQLKEVLANNENAQMQWDLCERVYRFNPLLDELAKGFGITPEQLDTMFKLANGEVV